MAVPSRKKSSTRTRKGRSVKNLKLKKIFFTKPRVICSACKNVKLLHYICLYCYHLTSEKTAKLNSLDKR